MGIFDPGSNNCSDAGKGFNDFLSIISLGMVSGPSDDECEAWKNKQDAQPPPEKKDYMTKIKEFFDRYKMEIGLIVIILIVMKL